MRLNGKAAIVTGGGSGIGKAVCLKFAEEGAKVIVADVNEEEARKVAEEIRATGKESISYEVDVSDYENVAKLMKATVERFKTVDILVNAAGIRESYPSEDLPPENWQRMIDVDLTGVFYCCQLAAREMIKKKKGKIVNISSTSGVRGEENNVHYVAAKHGVVGLTRALALDFAKYNINVNCICPALTITPGIEKVMSPQTIRERLRFIPLGRASTPEDQANAALFLASSESDFITGHILYVDGGQLAGKNFLRTL